MSRHPIDVVVPAHNEETLLPACLQGLIWQAADVDLRVVAVANGCSDRTVEILGSSERLFAEFEAELIVVELAEAHKARALNAGLAHVRDDAAVVFLDGDTPLMPGTLKILANHLSRFTEPRLAAPQPVEVRPRSWLARGFVSVWRELPAVKGRPMGAGCYAVNASGRRRIGEFPDVVADDAFVRGRFRQHEQEVVDRVGGFLVRYPEGRDLVAVVCRWRRGNRELRARSRGDDPSASLLENLRHIAVRPGLWPALPAFAYVKTAARVAAVGRNPRWERARGLRRQITNRNCVDRRPRVDVVIVTYNNAVHIQGCLRGITASLADLRVTVVDNGSRDGTAERVEGAGLVRRPRNIGFAAAVNEAAVDGSGDYILLVNPDVRLEPTTIDQLVATAVLTGAQLLGGRSHHEDGTLDQSCCLAAPNLWHALAFGLGLSSLPFVDPDSLGGWKRDNLRPVPVLTGALLLVSRELWEVLGGFDTSFFVYGEDADLCLRASEVGVKPTFTPAASYVHVGGASSSPATRLVLILTGKVTLYRKHLPRNQRQPARAALLVGVAMRRTAELIARREGRWTEVWRRRNEWSGGWPQRHPSSAQPAGL